jgi:hypothetical protein
LFHRHTSRDPAKHESRFSRLKSRHAPSSIAHVHNVYMLLLPFVMLEGFSPPPSSMRDTSNGCTSSSSSSSSQILMATTRRSLLASAVAAFSSTAVPRSANADGSFILLNPFDNEFLKVRNAQLELDALSRQLSKPTYQQNDDDRTMVFQLLGFQFKPTSKLMDKMIVPYGLMYDLTDADRAKGQEIARNFAESVLALEERNRARALVSEQLEVINGLSGLIDRYLEIAATKYDVPSKAAAERQ